MNLDHLNLRVASCQVGLNGPATGPNRAELNGSCHARTMGCLSGLSMAWLVLRAGPDPFPTMRGRARVRPNRAGRVPAHLPRAKFSGLVDAKRTFIL
jgi:hypothetical protein